MKRHDLERHLREHGCEFARHGGGHDVWRNQATGGIAAVPRHREIKDGTARRICRQLSIPPP